MLSQNEWQIALPEDVQTDTLFRLASSSSALITELQPDDEDLERVFHRLLDEGQPSTEQEPRILSFSKEPMHVA